VGLAVTVRFRAWTRKKAGLYSRRNLPAAGGKRTGCRPVVAEEFREPDARVTWSRSVRHQAGPRIPPGQARHGPSRRD